MRRANAYRLAKAALRNGIMWACLWLACVCPLPGCSNSSIAPSESALPALLPWPPTAEPTREVSALQQVTIPGNEASLCGGDYVYLDDSMLLLSSPKLTWAIYSLKGYRSGIRPKSVSFERSPDTDARSSLYLGIANFAKQRWEFPAGPQDDFAEFIPSDDYVSPKGFVYVAAVQWTVFDLRIMNVTITNDSDAPLPPAGLTAIPAEGGNQLSWQPSEGATAYNVLRSPYPDNVGAFVLAPEISGTEYLDTEAPAGVLEYYSVQAIGPGGTSWPCEPVSAYLPEIDLPAPSNLRTESYTDVTATLAWDWDQVSPGYFYVYIKEQADFNLDPPFWDEKLVGGSERSYVASVQPGHNYWFRVVAVKNFKFGALSEAVKIDSDVEWHWAPTETIGPGRGEVRSCVVNGELCAMYFDRDKFDILMARRNALGEWRVDQTGLNMQTDVLEDPNKYDGGFYNYADICHNGSKYFIVSQAIRSGALWYCLGSPEAGWKTALIAGDRNENTSGLTDGWWCTCSSTNGELGVLHSYLWAEPGVASHADAYLQTSSDQGESWSRTLLIENMAIGFHSLKGFNGEWQVVGVRQFPVDPPTPQEFWFMRSSESFAPHVLYSKIGEHFGLWPDLERFGDHWLSCAFDNNDTSLYALEGDGDNWTKTPVDGYPGAFVGGYCRLAVYQNEAAIVYVDSHEGWWQIARYKDGVWAPYAAILPADQLDSPDIQYVGDDIYVVFEDRTDNKIKCARAVPPVS